jgi:catechol 2,3-dioxygenase-like lactoylglutathione lyase family enzyme
MQQPPVDHVDLVVSSLERSLAFYLALLGPVGWAETARIRGERGETVVYIGPSGSGRVGLRERPDGADARPHDRYALGLHHLAVAAPSRQAVDACGAWAAAGGATVESPPREYDYAPGYYALFVRDPDDLKLEVVHQSAEGAA